jgi:hypothetical protein
MDDVSSLILGEQTKPKYSVNDVQNMIYGQESSFGKADTSKTNYAGATGPMQVTMPTFEGLKKKGLIPKEYDINNPQHNKEAGNALIADAYNRYEGDADKVLAEYYAGQKAINKDGSINVQFQDLKNPKAPNVGQYIEQAKSKYQPQDEISNLILGNNVEKSNNLNTTQNKPFSFIRDRAERLAQEKPSDTLSGIGEAVYGNIKNPIVSLIGAGKGIVQSIPEAIKTGEAPEPIGERIASKFIEENRYEPKTELGKKINEFISQLPEKVTGSTMGVGPLPELAPLLSISKEGVAGQAKNAISDLKQQYEKQIPKAKVTTRFINEPEMVGVGSAETSLQNQIKTALENAPEYLKQALKDEPLSKLANEENLKVIENHNKFAKFGLVPTEGQALENTSLMSDEFNARKKDPNLQARFEERDPGLIRAFNKIKEKVSDDVFENEPQRLASMPLDKVKNIYQEKEQNVANLWKEANISSGTSQSPIDVGALRENIINGLKEKQRTRYVPAALQADLDEVLSKGYMTPEEYENFRSDTATIARTNPDPMARQAAYIIRDKLEQVPLKDEFAQYKPKYDAARKATQDLHNFEKSPIVKAAISDTRTPDEIAAGLPHPAAKNFIAQHYSAKTPQVEIERMLDLIGRNSPEHQALNKLKIDEFKLNSGIVNDKGTVSQNALNKQIYEQHKTNLAPMFGQEVAKDLQDLADVANLTEPRKGVHSVNTSNTEIVREENAAKEAAKEAAGNVAAGIAEAKANAALPFAGTIIRRTLGGMKSSRQAKELEKLAEQESQRRLSPKAGIKLNDIANLGKK